VTPPPMVNAYFSPFDPSVFDNMSFSSSVYDPANIYGLTYAWTIGDGTSSDQSSFSHQFASDGDYALNLMVTTVDGRSSSVAQNVQVRTRDVSINKLSVPQMAAVNQTKTINVEIKNNRYSDYVQVVLVKGLPGGSEQVIGILTLYVPARATKPTTFKFSYTFTSSDATVGKVVFKATANLVNGRDALPSDNTAIVTTTVNR
jgi:PKD domain